MTSNHAPVPLRDYVDPDEPAYGRVVLYTVADVAYQHDTVADELDRLGLGSHAPRRPADVDVFRRVSTAAAVNRVPLGDTGTYANVMIRDVSNGGGATDSVLRRVVVEVVDAGNEQLDYAEAYDLRFHKDGGRLLHVPLLSDESPADDVVSGIRAEYMARRGTINGDAVRMLLKRVIRHSDGICIRPSGGVFFVPEAHVDTLEALHTWAAMHREHVQLMSFPLIKQVNGQGEDLLTAAFTSEAIDECEKLIGELMAGGVSERRLTAIAGEHAELSKRLRVYQSILSDTLGDVGTKVDALDMMVRNAFTGAAAA